MGMEGEGEYGKGARKVSEVGRVRSRYVRSKLKDTGVHD